MTAYKYVADDRIFYAAKIRKQTAEPDHPSPNNPLLWYSWELKQGEREYLTKGVKTLREAQQPIDKICGITG